jgi:hypothetical protein
MKRPTEDSESSIREIVFKKNNYGPISSSIVLSWRHGLFVPITNGGGETSRAAIAKDLFLLLLKRFEESNRSVNDKKGISYAPNLFAQEKEARETGCTKETLADAMRELLADKTIILEPYGRLGSRPNFKLVINLGKVKVKDPTLDQTLPF